MSQHSGREESESGPTIHDGLPSIPADFVQAVRDVGPESGRSLIDVAARAPVTLTFRRTDKLAAECRAVRAGSSGGWKDAGHAECFHHRPHARANPRALDPRAQPSCGSAPTLDAPPRTALWGS